jgi:hypothetical protein
MTEESNKSVTHKRTLEGDKGILNSSTVDSMETELPERCG